MHIEELPAAAALESLASGWDGLSTPEAARRLAEYGPNRVERVRTTPPWWRLMRQFTHLFAVVLWAAAALAAAAAWLRPGEGMGTLAVAILLVLLVNGAFSFWQEYRSERALESLRRLLPHLVRVRRDGVLDDLPAEALVPGDVVTLAEGDAVPADCRVVRGVGVQLDLSTLTGESVAVARDAAAATAAATEPAAARNVLPAGSSVVSGEVEAVVFATGMSTVLGGIAHITQIAGDQPSPLQIEVRRLSRLIALFAAGLGAVSFVIGWATGMALWQASLFAVGLAVANVPEGLLPTVTLALAMAGKRLARRNVLVRRLSAIEALGSTSVICTDKTGTLTQNRMVARVAVVDGVRLAAAALSGAGLAGRLAVETAGRCHSLEQVEGRLVGDPTEVALVEMAGSLPPADMVDGIPFDASRRRMALAYAGAEGAVLHVKGALEAVLPLCRAIAGRDRARPLARADRDAVLAAEAALAEDGYRVLALARRDLPAGVDKAAWEEDLTLLGLVALEDPPRPEVADAVVQCHRAGVKVVMVTGDHPRTAVAIARRIGLVRRHHPRVVVGDQLRRMSRTQLRIALDEPEIIFARTQAEQKWRIVEALQAKGAVVAVTGDGVNDAPALRQADIGIAMGASGTDVAREAAEMVLMDDNFASIVAAIEEGRAVFDNIRKFMTYILTSNIPEIVPYLAFATLGLPLGLTVVQILAIDLGTDMVPALALAAEKPRHDVMERPPRSRRERLIDAALLGRAYGFLGLLQAAGAMAAFLLVLGQGGWRWGAALAPGDPLYLHATTACLATVVVMQAANLLVCRSRDRSVFALALDNRMLPLGLAFEAAIILALVYLPLGQALFGTAPLGWDDWGRAALFALLLLAAEEARKALVRRNGGG